MARSRNIKPGFFVNDELGECAPIARLAFIGLWTIADREGRLTDRPKKIKSQVLPYDKCDMDAILKELESRKFILRYQVKGESYIQILNFKKHQQPHHKEALSEIPPCSPQGCSNHESTINQSCLNVASRLVDDEQPRQVQAHLIPDSLNLIPLTLNPEPGALGVVCDAARQTRQLKSEGGYGLDFEAFWNAYGKKTNLGYARGAWEKATATCDPSVIIQAAINQTALYVECGRQMGDMKAPNSWLDGECWAESLDIVRQTITRGIKSKPAATISECPI